MIWAPPNASTLVDSIQTDTVSWMRYFVNIFQRVALGFVNYGTLRKMLAKPPLQPYESVCVQGLHKNYRNEKQLDRMMISPLASSSDVVFISVVR